jgi:hypothetical protein
MRVGAYPAGVRDGTNDVAVGFGPGAEGEGSGPMTNRPVGPRVPDGPVLASSHRSVSAHAAR